MAFKIPENSPTTPPLPKPEADKDPLAHFKEPVNLDALLQEFNTPRQDFNPPPPPAGEEIKSIFDAPEPTGEASEPAPPITPEQAKKNGRSAAKMLDTGISFALKMFARDDSAKDYKASPEELDELADPLSDLSEKYNFKISPEIVLIFLIVTIYMPKYFIASERRQKALEERQNELERKFTDLKSKTID